MNKNYFIGVDLAYKPSWWRIFLVWLGVSERGWDYNAMVIGERKNGIFYIRDIRHYD